MERKLKTDKILNEENVFYCTNCGSQLHEGQDVCLNCGVFVSGKKSKVKTIKEKVKTKRNKSANFNLIEVIVIVIITGLLVATATGLIVYKNYDKFNINKEVNKTDNLNELNRVYNDILNKYFNSVDEKELVNSAVQGMYNYLGDPYSQFLNEADSSDLKEKLDGEFHGLGIEFTLSENGHEIMNVFDNSPAKNAGLEIGDIILKVNDTDVSSLSASDVASMIKNSGLTKVSLTIRRNGQEIVKEITLSNVVIPSVYQNKYDNVGYLNITTFSATTASQVSEALSNLEKENITGLVIDLRDNGGGLLNSAVDIASLFIEKGKKIYGIESNGSKKFYSDTTKESRNYKISVIINGGSASASEILAAALKESYGATLVGYKSYGKGTIQETSDLTTGGMVKVTTGYWLTPNGNNVNEKGITPDIDCTNIESEEDVALQKAIEAVK